MKKPYVIAEMGVNFYDTARVLGITPLDAAKLYIDKAAEAGIDCAKFQSYKADTIVGFSDHVAPDETMMTLAAAYMLGAEVIEKHFTLDKTLPGNDHYHAGEPEDFKKAIANFKWIDTVLGSNERVAFLIMQRNDNACNRKCGGQQYCPRSR